MRILAIGDVCGEQATERLLTTLPKFKKDNGVDFTLINGENSAGSNGISKQTANALLTAGADVISGGNHTLHRKDFRPMLDENERLLRPHNLPSAEYGSGYCVVDMGYTKVAVINLLGQVYLDMHGAENPFICADKLIEKAKADGANVILVDFHAEATSEKKALGFYLDGRVSAVVGTHTHVQTNDATVLKSGTAYITDLGMSGPVHSVLGVEPNIIIERFKNGEKGRFVFAEGEILIEGLLFEVDPKTSKALWAKTVKF
ncbi:MAG: TIGR00282 family metallophosphoesterase [Clostridia bacterium]|nr:TIGR00282 family metallophosphoesterase [Clostridia bacterium]